jgi:hypothetical protein
MIRSSDASGLCYFIQVQVLEPFTKDELQQRLELLQPTIVYFSGEIDSSRQEFGPLVLGDSDLCKSDDNISLFKVKMPNLVGVIR